MHTFYQLGYSRIDIFHARSNDLRKEKEGTPCMRGTLCCACALFENHMERAERRIDIFFCVGAVEREAYRSLRERAVGFVRVGRAMQPAAREHAKLGCKPVGNLRVVPQRGKIDGDQADPAGKIPRTQHVNAGERIQSGEKLLL